MEDSHCQQLGEMQQQHQHQAEVEKLTSKHSSEVTTLNGIIRKAKRWFPMLEARLQMENLCQKIGFTAEQTGVLLTGKALEFSGLLYSGNISVSSTWRMQKSKCSLILPSRTNCFCILIDNLLLNGLRNNGITYGELQNVG